VTTRRELALGLGVGLLAPRLDVCAQPTGVPRRVGVLGVGSAAAGTRTREAFIQGMQDLSWVEGRNIEYRIAYADGDAGRLDALARSLIEQRVAVIVCGASLAAKAAQRATKSIPIVLCGTGDPVALGFVASLARPGGNITGVGNLGDELLAKQIQILHEVAPHARRVAVVLNQDNPSHALYRGAASRACAALGAEPTFVFAGTPADLAGAVRSIVAQGSHAVAVAADPLYYSERLRLHEMLDSTHLPVAYGQSEHVHAGGLLSYATNYVSNFRAAANYVDKILRGARPGDLPVGQATRFELVINLKTANALGLKIPQSLLLRADEVIE
jgi:putative ABC transport system substrate-binding protein